MMGERGFRYAPSSGRDLPHHAGVNGDLAWVGPVLEHVNPGYLVLFPGRALLPKRPLKAPSYFPAIGFNWATG